MKRAVSLLFCLALGGCGNQSRGVRIDVGFGTSCSFTPSTYKIECVAAIEARLLDAAGDVLERECKEIPTGVFLFANDLVIAEDAVPVLENIAPHKDVRLEIRGYHGIVRNPCQAETSPIDDLMFWGRSALLDLTADNLDKIDVEIECRASCDCEALDQSESCPLAFSQSQRVCTPALLCRKSCNATLECWDGELDCVADQCSPGAETMCWECGSKNDCGDGLACVRHTTGDVSENFCAKLCPPANNFAACPGSMGCLLVDGHDVTLLP